MKGQTTSICSFHSLECFAKVPKMWKSVLKNIRDFSLSVILWILLAPFSTVLICFAIFRLIVHLLAKLFRPDLIPIWSPADSLTTSDPSESQAQMNISALCILQDKLDAQQFRNHFKDLFLSTKELKRKYINLHCHFVSWGGYIFKKPTEEINLDDRIREIVLEAKDQNEVEEFIGNYVDLSDYGVNPNWEILLIHVKKSAIIPRQMSFDVPKDLESLRTILVFKFHHGLCDGYSLIHLVDKLSGDESPYLVHKQESSVWEKINLFWSAPLTTCKLLISIFRSGAVPWMKLKDKEDKEMYISWGQIPLEQFKSARRLAGCRFSTLLGFIQAETSRRFFANKRPGNNLPKHIWLWTPWPQPDHPVMFGAPLINHLTIFGFKVRTDDSSDILSKINEAEQHCSKLIKRWKLPELLFRVGMPLTWPLPACVHRFGKKLLPNGNTASKFGHVFSSSVRPLKTTSFLGIPMERSFSHIACSSTVRHTRFQVWTTSSGGYVNFTFAGRKDTFHGKDEIDYIAKVLVNEVFNDIQTQLKIRETHDTNITCGNYA